ncbi:MAG: hypothetical protein ACJ0Q9_00080 [Gammaproteobacteria bacterium]
MILKKASRQKDNSVPAYSLNAKKDERPTNYEKGSYITSSHYKTVMDWYITAAESGEASAQYNLGVIYKNGDGVPRNDKVALKWWTLAAQQGHPKAALNVGVMYQRGDTVPRNIATAIKWYSLAGAQSHVDQLLANGANKSIVEGIWSLTNKKNCHVWNPIPQLNETVSWSGSCANGRVNGNGSVVWSWDSDSGKRYSRIIEGEFRNGIRVGRVKITYENRDVYVGTLDLITGEINGDGSYTDREGNTYVGELKNGEMHGKGSLTSALGSHLENGTWTDSTFTGEGTIVYETGDRYTGDIVNGEYHGQGTFIWTDGTKYVGGWENGMKHGDGAITYPDGQLRTGNWTGGWRDGD